VDLTLRIQLTQVAGFLLVLVRSTAWVSVCPPFGTRMVPVQVKLGFAVALALSVTPRLANQAVPLEIGPLAGAAAVQVTTGLALGFLGVLLFSAVQGAGALVDLFGGFSTAQLFDPMSGNQASVFGRFYQLLGTVLLFAIDGHLLLVRGFLTSFDVVPAAPDLAMIGHVFTGGLATLFVAALEIAAPLLAAMFLTDLALGLLAKAAPEMNVFLLGLPVKLLLTIGLVGVALPLLPDAVSSLAHSIVTGGARIAGG
jgi:flagellar biosynthetic protein FliR